MGESAPDANGTPVTAPFAGLLLRVEAKPGTTVAKGATVVVLESMKMETALSAPVGGVVESVHYAAGTRSKAATVVATVRRHEYGRALAELWNSTGIAGFAGSRS